MNHRLESMDAEKLRRLQEDERVTIMQPEHTIQYEPWRAERVMRCVDSLANITCRHKKKQDIERAVQRDAELSEFATTHTVFYRNLTDPQFVRNPKHMETLKRIILLRLMQQRGQIDEKQAQMHSSDIAIRALMQQADS